MKHRDPNKVPETQTNLNVLWLSFPRAQKKSKLMLKKRQHRRKYRFKKKEDIYASPVIYWQKGVLIPTRIKKKRTGIFYISGISQKCKEKIIIAFTFITFIN